MKFVPPEISVDTPEDYAYLVEKYSKPDDRILSVVYCHTHGRMYAIAAELPDYAIPPSICQQSICGLECDCYVESHLKITPDGVIELTPLIDRSGGNWHGGLKIPMIDAKGDRWHNPNLEEFFRNYFKG